MNSGQNRHQNLNRCPRKPYDCQSVCPRVRQNFVTEVCCFDKMASNHRPASSWSCQGCGVYILDETHAVKVDGNTWHANCLKCNDCETLLEEKCYSKNNVLYCKKDYFGRFAPKCRACNENLQKGDIVRSVQNFVFHESCLRCAACSKKFTTGDCLYGIEDMKIVCPEHYATKGEKGALRSTEDDSVDQKNDASATNLLCISGETREDADFSLKNNFTNNGVDSCDAIHVESEAQSRSVSEFGCVLDKTLAPGAPSKNNMADSKATSVAETAFYGEGGKSDDFASLKLGDGLPCRLDLEDVVNSRTTTGKKRGPRTTIKSEQQEVLTNAFKKTPKPSRHIREELSRETGLAMRVIQVWFQNRRSKERRMKQVNVYGSKRHLYSRLPQRQLQNSFLVRPTECPTPNMVINSGTTRMGMYQFTRPTMSIIPREQILHASDPYYNAISPHHQHRPPHLPLDFPRPFPDVGRINCHGDGDPASFPPYSDECTSDYFSEKSFMDDHSAFQVNGVQAAEFYPQSDPGHALAESVQ